MFAGEWVGWGPGKLSEHGIAHFSTYYPLGMHNLLDEQAGTIQL